MKREFVLRKKTHKTVEEVYSIFADILKFAELHPLIVDAERLNEKEFLITEKMKLGLFSLNFKYKSLVEADHFAKKVSYIAKPMFQSINIAFSISESGGKTLVEENVSLSGLPGSINIIEKLIKENHTIILDQI